MSESNTTALAKRETATPKPLGPLLALETIARHASRSGMFKKYGNESGAFMVCALGYELGLSPVAALTSIHLIDGKPVMSANLMLSLVYASGTHDVRIKKRENDGCVLEWFRKEAGEWIKLGESSFTKEDAARAKLLTKDNWVKYPKALCFARAASDGFKTYCPHLANGQTLYTPEELGAEVNAEGEMIDVEVRVVPSSPAREVSLDDLRDLLDKTKTDQKRICTACGVESLEELTPDQILEGVEWLEMKLRAMPVEEPAPAVVEKKEKKKRGN